MDKTGIEWTDATWNPIRGCSRVSNGCRNCYAERVAGRFSGPGLPYEGVATMEFSNALKGGDGKFHSRWTGDVVFVEHALDQPLRWRRPRKIFVNSMSDLFHERVDGGWIDKIFAVMALAPQHVFQILTKRPERMLDYFQMDPYDRILRQADKIRMRRRVSGVGISDPNVRPLPNVWLGVSVEDQQTADVRIPLLLETPAAVRWVSAEPLLGPVSFRGPCPDKGPFIDWVVAGGESGPGSRPMHPDWVRSIRDQCVVAGKANRRLRSLLIGS